jgi:hypothetical protein
MVLKSLKMEPVCSHETCISIHQTADSKAHTAIIRSYCSCTVFSRDCKRLLLGCYWAVSSSVTTVICFILLYYSGARGGVVVKALHYRPAGRGFDSRWCHWNFSVT